MCYTYSIEQKCLKEIKMKKFLIILSAALLVIACNPFPYRSESPGGAVWSDDDSLLLYYNLGYWETDLFAIDTTHKWSPWFELYTINPDGSVSVSLGVRKDAWPEEIFYMRDAGFLVYGYHFDNLNTAEICYYSLSTGAETIIVTDEDTFDSDSPAVVPSPGGTWLAVMESHTGEVTYPLEIPVIELSISFINASTLTEIFIWQGTFEEYYNYWWITDDVMLIRDEVSWNEADETYQGYVINPAIGSVSYGEAPDTDELPITSSSPVSADGTGVYIDEAGLHYF